MEEWWKYLGTQKNTSTSGKIDELPTLSIPGKGMVHRETDGMISPTH